MDLSSLLRPEVKGFEPYLPGKPIQEVQRELGLKKIVKLASNENALESSPRAVAAIRRESTQVFRYPEGPGTLLRRALARRLKVDETEIILGAGSDELIELLGKTFFRPGDEIVVSDHAFIRYKMAGDLMGIRTLSVPMRDYTHDLAAMADQVNARTKAVFIANPNNPTGTYVNKNAVRDFLARIKRRRGVSALKPFIVFDEAYYEYSRGLVPDYPETLDYFKKSGLNIMILRTFSKIHGLAGLRVGYGVARRDAVQALDRVRPPFNVSNVAQAAAVAALSDPGHVKKSVEAVRKGMDYLVDELWKLDLAPVPSAANFVLVDLGRAKGRDLFKKLLHKGVIVRAMDEYGLPNFIRVTVGRPDENKFFIQKLREVV